MSEWNDELVTLKDGLDTDLSADLDECVKAADAEAVSEGLVASASTKLALVGTGSTIAATLGGKLGKGPCSKKGTGAFTGNQVSLAGKYTLTVSRTTAKLADAGGKEVYKGKGLEKGLTGTWEVKF